MSQFKIPLIVCITVFLLSGLFAFLGGSSYLGIAFKAVVSALVALVFVFVAKFLLEKHLPDLFENEDETVEVDSSLVVTNINVRIGGGEESPVDVASSLQKETSATDNVALMEGLSDDALVQEDPLKDVEMEAPNFKPLSFGTIKEDKASLEKTEASSHNAETTTRTEKKTKNELKDNDALLEKEGEGVPTPPNTPTNASNSDKDNEDEASLPLPPSTPSAVDDARLSEQEITQAMEKDVDRLEELPDLHEFVDSSAALKQSKAEELMSTGTQSFFETNLSEDVGTDSKLMANAIRTVLRRE